MNEELNKRTLLLACMPAAVLFVAMAGGAVLQTSGGVTARGTGAVTGIGSAEKKKGRYTREEFSNLALNRFTEDIIKAVGKPDRTVASAGKTTRPQTGAQSITDAHTNIQEAMFAMGQTNETWFYDNAVYDSMSGKKSPAEVIIQNGAATKINFR